MPKLSATMLSVLIELRKPEAFLHYMPYMGSFRPNPYYFFHESMKHVRCSTVNGLIERGLAESYDGDRYATNLKVRISEKGRSYLRQSACA
jgi:hypothetical protein